MIRRLPILVAALALAGTATLSSCVVPDTDAVAEVDGVDIPEGVLETLLADEAASPDDESAVASGSGQTARTYLTSLIKSAAAQQVSGRYGFDLVPGRTTALEQITGTFTGDRLAKWNALDPDDKNLIADFGVAMEAMRGKAGDAPADLEKRYANPESTGFYCVRYLFIDSKSGADEAYKQLLGGADFAEYADALNNQSNGGALTAEDGNACLPLDQFGPQSVDTDVALALHDGVPGTVIKPVRATTDQGEAWLILLHRPWAEIAADLQKAVAAQPSYAEYLAMLSTAKISVAARYGVWNPATLSVEQHD